MVDLKTSPKCQTMECLHSNWMTYWRSLPKEFRKYFEEACKELNIPLYVLPPYSPKYNGRIEAQSRKMMCLHNHFNLLVCEVRMERSDRQISNRIIREEFYNNKKLLENCITRADYNDKLKEYIDKYNNYRPHQALYNLQHIWEKIPSFFIISS